MATQDRFDCPPALDLLEYSAGSLPAAEAAAIRGHLERCDVCADVLKHLRAAEQNLGTGLQAAERVRVVPEEIRRASAEPAGRFRTLLKEPAPLRARFGQIWSTKLSRDSEASDSLESTVTPRLVALLGEESPSVSPEHASLPVAPISLDIAYRSDRDLVVPAEESPLGYPFMVEVWNEATALKEQLGRYFGALDQPFKRYLGLLYQAQLGADVDLSPLSSYLGPAISHDDDPRFAFQEDESEACEYLRLPLLWVLGEAEREAAEAPAEIVRRLAREHLPSAFPNDEGETPELTVGDVAARVRADQAAGRSISAADLKANRRLLENTTVVPGPVTIDVITWVKERSQVAASERYWESFRRAAVILGMARQRNQIQLAAARRQESGNRRTRQSGRSGRQKGRQK